jgi:hypothetical protein
VYDTDGNLVFDSPLEQRAEDREQGLAKGQRVRLVGAIENQLTPGRHSLGCWVARSENLRELALQNLEVMEFVVYGTRPGFAPMRVDNDVIVIPEGD